MMRWMFCLSWMFCLVGLPFLSLAAQANPCPGGFAIWGEYLYVKPSFDEGFFALVQETPGFDNFSNGPVRRVNDPFHYTSAGRVGGMYAFCNNGLTDIHLEGTYLHATANRRVDTLGFIAATDSFPIIGILGAGTVESRNKLCYYAIDLLFGHRISFCSPFSIYLEAGLQYMHLFANRKVNLTTPGGLGIPTNFIRTRCINWALGPELGIQLAYRLPWSFLCNDSLSLVARGRMALLVSQARYRLSQAIIPTPFPPSSADVKNESHYRVVPYGDIRLGVDYSFIPSCFQCVRLDAEVGYELMTYNRLIDWVHFDGFGSVTSFDNYSDFDMHGLYVAVRVIF